MMLLLHINIEVEVCMGTKLAIVSEPDPCTRGSGSETRLASATCIERVDGPHATVSISAHTYTAT